MSKSLPIATCPNCGAKYAAYSCPLCGIDQDEATKLAELQKEQARASTSWGKP